MGEPVVQINGRSPGFGSSWMRAVDSDTTVIVLGNICNGVPRTLAGRILDMARGERFPLPTLSRDPPPREVVEAVVGAYRFGPDFYRATAVIDVRERDGHLFNGSSWLIPTGDWSLVHRVYWSTLRFVSDDAGAVQELRHDEFVGKRVR